MINAKEKFLEHVNLVSKENTDSIINVMCAILIHDYQKVYVLNKDYCYRDYLDFLDNIDFEYSDNQFLKGIIWYDNNTWSERELYGTNQYWQYRRFPDINKSIEEYIEFRKRSNEPVKYFGNKESKTDKITQSLGGNLTSYGEIQNLKKILKEYLKDYNLAYNYYDCSYEDDGSDLKYYLNYLDNEIKDNLKKLREQLEKFEE